MAAATFTIEVMATGVFEPCKPDSAGWRPNPSSQSPKFAMVAITPSTGDYAAGGVACNILGALTGWTTIVAVIPTITTQNGVPSLVSQTYPNTAKKLTVSVLSTGAEHADSALSADQFVLMVFGA